MPTKYVPINGSVLSWAIQDAGLTVDEVAQGADVGSDEIESWIRGEDRPSTGAINSVAKVLGRSQSFFLRPRPPQRRSAQVSLRVPYGERGERELTPDERVQVRMALRRQAIAKFAANTSPRFEAPRLPGPEKSPEESAETARQWLHWTVLEQFSAASKSAVTRELRLRLESRNILVLQLKMGEKACRGISVHDERVPLIVYNSTGQTASARSFTMLHELAHLMHGEDVVCGSADSAHERWCDRFAAAFLMPRDLFLDELRNRLRLSYVGPTDDASVKKLSDQFKCSYQSVALRLWQLGAADFALFEYLRDEGIEDPPGFARGGAATPEVRLREYGTGYARLLLDAYRSDALSEADVRKYLDVNGPQLAVIANMLAEAR
jgi:Zn-dependent peptidase ImmA (M78 family)